MDEEEEEEELAACCKVEKIVPNSRCSSSPETRSLLMLLPCRLGLRWMLARMP